MKHKIYFLFIIPLFAFTLHKYHLSITKIILNNNTQTIQITMRCFIDDIEAAINKSNNINSELSTDREVKNIDSLLQNYLLNRFKIKVNNNTKKLTFIGKEYEKDIIFFYFETDTIKKIQTFEVQNKVLLKTFKDQQNIIKVNLNNKKSTLFLKNKNDKEMLKFD